MTTRRPDAGTYVAAEFARYAALVIFACAAVYDYVAGFIQGVLKARREHLRKKEEAPQTPFPSAARPRPRPRPQPRAQATATRTYEVLCRDDSEVTLNGLPIGHIDAAPWQFCSYDADYGNGPARESKARAFDDACDYAETVFSYSHKN